MLFRSSDESADEDGCMAGEDVVCNDGISCTTDECDEVNDTCEYTPDHVVCDDGQWCNGTEYCSDVAGCYHVSAPNCNDAFSCTLDSCDEQNNICSHQPRNWLCTDTSVCNGEETCVVGSGCVGGAPLNCADVWSCTEDTCDDLEGGCVHEKVHSACDDGLACNGEEMCEPDTPGHNAQGCVAGTSVDCEDGVSCTVGACQEAPPNGYYCEQEPYDTLCDDNDHCNGVETCDEIHDCQSGVAKDCNDFVDCTDDGCDPVTGHCVNEPNDGNCTNSNPCRPLIGCDADGGCMYDLLEDGTSCNIKIGRAHV